MKHWIIRKKQQKEQKKHSKLHNTPYIDHKKKMSIWVKKETSSCQWMINTEIPMTIQKWSDWAINIIHGGPVRALLLCIHKRASRLQWVEIFIKVFWAALCGTKVQSLGICPLHCVTCHGWTICKWNTKPNQQQFWYFDISQNTSFQSCFGRWQYYSFLFSESPLILPNMTFSYFF